MSDKKKKKKRKLTPQEKREKKLTDATGKDFYPFYALSQRLYPFSHLSFVVVFALLAFYVINLKVLPRFIPNINQELTQFVSLLQPILNFFDSNHGAWIVNVAPLITRLTMWGQKALSAVVPVAIVFVACYWLTMLMRMHFGEEQPFADDRLARSIKHSFLYEQHKLTTSREDFFASKDSDIKKRSKERQKAIEKLRKMKVEIHTRKENRGDNFYRTAEVTVIRPKDKKEESELNTYLSDGIEQLQRASGSELIFRQLSDTKQRTYLFKSVPKDVTPTYLDIIKRHKHIKNVLAGIQEDEENVVKSQYTFPLEIIKLKNSNDDEKLRLIEKWAKNKETEIESFLVTCSTFVQKQSSEVGTASLSLIYLIGDFKKATSGHQLSDQLSNFLGIPSITVTIDAGRMTISVPIPSSLRLSMDMSRIFQESFGLDERAPESDED